MLVKSGNSRALQWLSTDILTIY